MFDFRSDLTIKEQNDVFDTGSTNQKIQNRNTFKDLKLIWENI